MNLEVFLRNVRGLCGKQTVSAPFLCDGSPLDCEILLLSDRPPLSGPSFWSYVDPVNGFRRREWMLDELNKSVHSLSLWERSVVEWMQTAAAPYRVLEAFIAPDAHGMPGNPEETARFGFILQTVKPRVVAAAGEHTAQFLSLAAAQIMRRDDFVDGDLGYGPVQLIALPTLSADWTEARARVAGSRFRHSLQSRLATI